MAKITKRLPPTLDEIVKDAKVSGGQALMHKIDPKGVKLRKLALKKWMKEPYRGRLFTADGREKLLDGTIVDVPDNQKHLTGD